MVETASRARSGLGKKRILVAGIAIVVIALAVTIMTSIAPETLPASINVYVDPQQSSCKGGSTFSCTIVLESRRGDMSASSVRSVQINGTNTQPTVTTAGGSVTILATLPSISMQHGLADIGPSVKPPSV